MNNSGSGQKLTKRPWLVIAIVLVLVFGGGVAGLRAWYVNNLQPVSSSSKTMAFTIDSGSGLHAIASKLKKNGLIKSTRAFETYVRSNELHDKLQAGTYLFSPSLSVKEIAAKIVNGEIAKNLLTILPQKRLDEIKQTFVATGYSKSQIDDAFNPDTYSGHPALVSRPGGASLEGYLYPDSYEKLVDTPPQTIIRESLNQMQKHLTADITNGFAAHSLNIYQGITLASIVAEETDDPKYQPMIAQVLLLRLQQGIPLQADVTAFYASQLAEQSNSLKIDSPYNTYLHAGLPPGPISNTTYDAMQAVAQPSNSDYLFFVAGDDDKIYFSRTQAEHDAAVAKYCIKKCGG